METQRAYFYTGATLPVETRRKWICKLRQAILERESRLTEALYHDLGKHAFESYICEIGMVLEEIRYTLRHLEKWCRPRKVRTPRTCFPATSRIYQDPYGVCLILSPWNYPVQLTLTPLVSALAAGNCVVIKPSAVSPHTSQELASLIADTFPPELVTCVEGGRAENQALLHEKFDYIFFTGSVAVGRQVMIAAAENLTPCTLELGGKSPCIVDSSADIELAAKRIAWGKFLNAGQTCVAPDYLLVHTDIQEEFTKRLIHWVQNYWGKKALDNDDYAHIINPNILTVCLP